LLSVRIFDFSLCYLCDIFDFTLLDFNQALSNFWGTDQFPPISYSNFLTSYTVELTLGIHDIDVSNDIDIELT
jgi:hypothetical protein